MIELKDIDIFYGNIQALRKVSLKVGKREIVSLIGANGSGKSTAIKGIAGIVGKKSGNVLFEGRKVTNLSVSEISRLGIAIVPESRRLFGPLSVVDNLNLGAYLRFTKGRRKEVKKDLELMFELFPRLRERRKQAAGTLSGGEQQMVAIARALMARPKVILMDEPSTGLAPKIVKEIFSVIKHLKEEGNTLLLVEQNARMALKISDRAYVLESGCITLEGTAEELLEDDSVKRAYLGV